MSGKGKKPRDNVALAVGLTSLAIGMVCASFAAVQLYRIFCQVTGYGGATQRAAAASEHTVDRSIIIRFDGNVSGLPWKFTPAEPVEVKLGETALVDYVAENTGSTTTKGTATFNVQPSIAGIYFNKIECFCFTEQELAPGERVEMPVQFFVSPDLAEDRDLASTRTITLSYTFFPVAGERQPVARSDSDETGKNM